MDAIEGIEGSARKFSFGHQVEGGGGCVGVGAATGVGVGVGVGVEIGVELGKLEILDDRLDKPPVVDGMVFP